MSFDFPLFHHSLTRHAVTKFIKDKATTVDLLPIYSQLLRAVSPLGFTSVILRIPFADAHQRVQTRSVDPDGPQGVAEPQRRSRCVAVQGGWAYEMNILSFYNQLIPLIDSYLRIPWLAQAIPLASFLF